MPDVSRVQDIAPVLRARESSFLLERKQTEEILHRLEKNLNRPSFLGYFLYFFAGAIIDLWSFVEFLGDFLVAGTTGPGVVLWRIVCICINIATGFLMWLVALFLGRRIKKTERATERISTLAQKTVQRIARMRRYYARAIRILRKIKILRRPIRKVALLLRKFTKKTRIPAVKTFFASIMEIVPWIDLLPWQTWGVYTTLKDHRSAYKDGLEQIEYCKEVIAAQDEEFSESQIALYEDMLEQATQLEEPTELG